MKNSILLLLLIIVSIGVSSCAEKNDGDRTVTLYQYNSRVGELYEDIRVLQASIFRLNSELKKAKYSDCKGLPNNINDIPSFSSNDDVRLGPISKYYNCEGILMMLENNSTRLIPVVKR